MDNLLDKLKKRGFLEEEVYDLIRKIAAVEELEQWSRTVPPMEAEEEQGWQSAKNRILEISKRSQSSEDAAEAIRQIVEMVPSPQTPRDRGRLRGLNEALDVLSKGMDTGQTQTMDMPPPAGHSNIPGNNPVPRVDGTDSWTPGGGSNIPRDQGMGTTRMSKKASREETIFLITPEGYTYTRDGSEPRCFHSALASDFIFDNTSRDNSIAGIVDEDTIYGFPFTGVYREEWFTNKQISSLIEISKEYGISRLDVGTSDLKHLQGNREMLTDFSLNPISEEDNLEEWYNFHLSYPNGPFYNYLINSYNEDFGEAKNLNSISSSFLVAPPFPPPRKTIQQKFALSSPNGRPEFGVQFNRQTFEYEPWIFDGPLPGGDCKLVIDENGNHYWWRTENMRPQHMEFAYAVEKKGLNIEMSHAGEWSDVRDGGNGPVQGSMGYPILHTFDESDPSEVEEIRRAFPDWDYIVNWDHWMPLSKVEKTADWDFEEDCEDERPVDVFIVGPEGNVIEHEGIIYHDALAEDVTLKGESTEGYLNVFVDGCWNMTIMARVERGEIITHEITPVQAKVLVNKILENDEFKSSSEEHAIHNVSIHLENFEFEGTTEEAIQVLGSIAKTAQNLTGLPPTFNMRVLFDLSKYVELYGEEINWDAFRSSSKSPDDEIQSLLEIITEIGVAQNADQNEIGGRFYVDSQKLKTLLQNERTASMDVHIQFNPTEEEALTYEKFILHEGNGWFWESEDYEYPTHSEIFMQLEGEGELTEDDMFLCVMGRNYGDFIYAYTLELPEEEAKQEISAFYKLPVYLNDDGPERSITSAVVDRTPSGIELHDEPFQTNNYSIGILWEPDYELYWEYTDSGENKAMHGDVINYIMHNEDSFASSYESDKFRHDNLTDSMIYGNYWTSLQAVEMNSVEIDDAPDWAIQRAFDKFPEARMFKLNEKRYPLRHRPHEYEWFGGDPDIPLFFQQEEEAEEVANDDSNDAFEVGFVQEPLFSDGERVLIAENVFDDDGNEIPMGMSAEIIGFVNYDVPIIKTEDGRYTQVHEDDLIKDISKTSILHFYKFAERSDVERKADQIFNQGGIEFVSATPDRERQRTLWEFDVTSTSGQSYPLYGDTEFSAPGKWMDWFDVACSCDWGRWNYDRAPEYRHLERFPCSHALATEKWLSQNGANEQNRALQTQPKTPAPTQTPPAQPAVGLLPQQQGTNPPAPAQTDVPARPAEQQTQAEPPPPPEPQVVKPTFREQTLRPRQPLEK